MSPDFRAHPEFGYFCLSRAFRRKARNAVISTVAVGVLGGALVLWARDDPHDDAVTIARIVDAPSSIDTISTVDQTTTAPTAEKPDPQAGIKAACAGDNWIYIDGVCVMRRANKPASLATAMDGPQIAALPAGAGALPVAAPSSGSRREDTAVEARASAPAATEPARQSSPGQKTARKTPRSRIGARELDRADSVSRDRSDENHRRARNYATTDDRPQIPSQKSAMRWARRLQECIGAIRCRAGDQLLRAFLSGGI
jgi:hypothetical protein